MSGAMKRATWIGVFLALATAGITVWAVLGSLGHTCQVCVTFHGRTECREATGPSPEEATRTAQDNACAFLASGMTDSVACSGTQPQMVSCDP